MPEWQSRSYNDISRQPAPHHPANPGHPKHAQWLALAKDPQLAHYLDVVPMELEHPSVNYCTIMTPPTNMPSLPSTPRETVSRLAPRSTSLGEKCDWNLLLQARPDTQYPSTTRTFRGHQPNERAATSSVKSASAQQHAWMNRTVQGPMQRNRPLQAVKVASPSSSMPDWEEVPAMHNLDQRHEAEAAPCAKIPPAYIYSSNRPKFLSAGKFCPLYPSCRAFDGQGGLLYCRNCLNVGLGPYETVERDKMAEATTIKTPSVTKKTSSKVDVFVLADCFRHMVMRKRGNTWASLDELQTVLTNAGFNLRDAKTLSRGYFRQCAVPLSATAPTEVFVQEYIKLQWHFLLMVLRARFEAFGSPLHNGVMFSLKAVGKALVKRLGKQFGNREIEGLCKDLGKLQHEDKVAWEEAIAWYLQKEEDIRVSRLDALAKR